ncbi:S-layer homology domain-containing protein [Anaerotignum faecicola]
MKKTKHTVALALAAMLACQPLSVYAATFADMNQAPWAGAEASINKAASLGLAVGETRNGKTHFLPRDSVSLSESCQLAYKLLIQTGKAKADDSVTQKWTPIMNAYGIQSWAYPAVSYCLENGILATSNLSGFMKNGSNLPATREQAATILGRALTKGVSSYTANETTTTFLDNSRISTEAKPYVALLKRVGVVNGDDSNKFNPKKTLNRTETAVLVTNLYGVLEKATTPTTPTIPTTPTNPTISTQKGTVATMTNFYVNLKDSAAYYMLASGGTTITLNGSSATMSDIVKVYKAGTSIDVTLTLDSSLHITKLEATYKETKKTKGSLTKVRYNKTDKEGSITIDKDSTYSFTDKDDVDIRIDKKSYSLKELYDLFTKAEDDKATIEVEVTLDNKGNLTKITGSTKDSDSSDSLKGKISDMSYNKFKETGYIKLKGKTTKYEIDDTEDVTVKIDNKTKTYKDLYKLYDDGDSTITVTLTLNKKDYVTKITATTSDSDSKDDADGNVANVTYKENKDTGTVKIGSKTYDIDDVDDVDISITDGSDKIKTWEDFYNAYKDKKTMNVSATVKNDEVTKITGKVTQAKGELSKLGKNYIKITGKYSDNVFSYDFDEDDTDNIKVNITNASGVKTLTKLIDWLESGDKLDLVLTLDKNGNITKISGEYK